MTPRPRPAGTPLQPTHAGLAGSPPEALADLVLGAWDEFCDLATGLDLDAPVRLPGWRVRHVLVHLGSWDDSVALSRMLAEARGAASAGQVDVPVDNEASNREAFARHLDASALEIAAALAAAREEVRAYLDGPEVGELGLRPVRSLLGPLPLSTVLVAAMYELAVHALDLQSAGGRAPSDRLLDSGLAALVDMTGCLAARHGVTAQLAALTPQGGWAFDSRGGEGWTTTRIAAKDTSRPTVAARAAALLDASAGRRNVVPMILKRELVPHHVPGLMKLSPLVEEVPGLPGGPVLAAAIRHLDGVGRLVRRLPGLGR